MRVWLVEEIPKYDSGRDTRRGGVALLQVYKRLLSTVSPLKYLGRVLTVAYDNWEAVISNLRKAQKRLAIMLRILGQEGVNAQVFSLFYMDVV